jgi:multiple sugar transport system substrate-binding protein
MVKTEKSANYKWRKFLKIFGISALAVAMAVSLTGCGTTTAPKSNSIIVWGFVDPDVFAPIIKDFENNNKGVTVTYVKKTLDANYEDNSLNSILAGQGPDVWALPNDAVYRHKDQLVAVPTTLLTANKLAPSKYFLPNVVSDTTFDNQVYAMAPSTDVLQIYYNPDLFNQARTRADAALKNNQTERSQIDNIFNHFPVTWADFDAIIPWLTVRNGNTIQTAGAAIGTSNNVSHATDLLSLLMLQNQTKMVSDDLSQATFDLPITDAAGSTVFPGKNSLDFYTKYANPSDPDYTWNASMPNDVDAFAQGKVAMIFSYANLMNYFAQIYPNFTYQRALVPQVGDLNPVVDYSNYTTYGVPANSVNSNLAWSFIIQLATSEAQTYDSATKELSSHEPNSPTMPVLKGRDSGSQPNNDTAQSIVTWNKGRYPNDVDTELSQAIDRVNAGSQNSQSSLDTAAVNVTTLLRKSTW